MLLSHKWLHRYIKLNKTPDEITEALTLIGFEVEDVTHIGLPHFEHVVVGKILSSDPHPDADRLSVCKVDTASELGLSTIVCGAKNYKVGDHVPVALPGAILPGGFEIKRSKLRGVDSEGMMCSPKELGMGDDHGGLLILENKPNLGTPINQVYPETDIVFDIEVTPNRPDCLSHLGMARELAAYFGLTLLYPEIIASGNNENGKEDTNLISNLNINTPENCPYYRAYSILNVTIRQSPEWMQLLLKSIGLRPINNVVDVTNFVLHELGQPLHAFDATKILGGNLTVRLAEKDEKITTLDDKERLLDSTMTVIADDERSLVIGGVMGSVDAEVDNNTRNIVLEAAYFNPSNIRATSRKLGLSSDSSYRFERGVDSAGLEFAAMRAIDLILETAGGNVVEVPLVSGAPLQTVKEIIISPDYIRKTLGFHVDDKDIKRVFESLEFLISIHDSKTNGKEWYIKIPEYRIDLDRPIDLVEEFLRIYGTDKIPEATVQSPGLISCDNPITVFNRKVSAYLVGQNFSECLNYSLRSKEELEKWFTLAASQSLGLSNPLASDQSHLRTSLLPGLLDTIILNQNRRNNPQRLFEAGRVFREKDGLLWEAVSVGFVMLQSKVKQDWLAAKNPDLFSAKKIVLELLKFAGIKNDDIKIKLLTSNNQWQEGHSASAGNTDRGWETKFGMLNLSLLKEKDIEGTVIAGWVTILPELIEKYKTERSYQPLSNFPPVTKDLALVVDESVLSSEVRNKLSLVTKDAVGKQFNIESIEVFDVYQGDGLPEGKKSLAFSLIFRADDRTLTDVEVNKVFLEIQNRITDDTGYSIRV